MDDILDPTSTSMAILDHFSSMSWRELWRKILAHQKTSSQDWRQNNKNWVKIRRWAGNMFGRSTGTEGVGDHPLRPKKRLMSFHWIHKHIHTKPIAKVFEIIINKHNVFKVPRKKQSFKVLQIWQFSLENLWLTMISRRCSLILQKSLFGFLSLDSSNGPDTMTAFLLG